MGGGVLSIGGNFDAVGLDILDNEAVRAGGGVEVVAGTVTLADVGLEVALLSSAAWQSAQMSQAVQYLDFDVMRELSEVYEVQDLYERVQSAAVDNMTEAMRTAQDDPAAAVRQGMISLALLGDLRTSLAEVYGTALEELESEGR